MMSSTPTKSPSDKQATTTTKKTVEAKRDVKASAPQATSSWWWPFSSTPEQVKHKINPSELEAVKAGLNKTSIQETREEKLQRELESERKQAQEFMAAQKARLNPTTFHVEKIKRDQEKQLRHDQEVVQGLLKSDAAHQESLKQIKYKAVQMKAQRKNASSIIGQLVAQKQLLKLQLKQARSDIAVLVEREAKRIEAAEAEKAKAEAAASQGWLPSLFGSSTPAAAPAPTAPVQAPAAPGLKG